MNWKGESDVPLYVPMAVVVLGSYMVTETGVDVPVEEWTVMLTDIFC